MPPPPERVREFTVAAPAPVTVLQLPPPRPRLRLVGPPPLRGSRPDLGEHGAVRHAAVGTRREAGVGVREEPRPLLPAPAPAPTAAPARARPRRQLGRRHWARGNVYVYAKLPDDPKGPPKHLAAKTSDLLPDLAHDPDPDPTDAEWLRLMDSSVDWLPGVAQHRVDMRAVDCDLVDVRHL